MGLLTEGTPLSWEETKKYADHVRRHGIRQFIALHDGLKDRKNDGLKWGEEIEYILVHFDDANRRARVALRAVDILPKLMQAEKEAAMNGDEHPSLPSLWRPEYAAYMVEGTPGQPYGSEPSDWSEVEANMRARRKEVQALLPEGEAVLSISAFPRTGCSDFTFPPSVPTPKDGISRSLWFPDAAIFPDHPRFSTLNRNAVQRSGQRALINLPLFKDERTPSPFHEDFSALGDEGEAKAAAKDDHIYMDAMGFGTGCCCLQVTFQASDLEEARLLYDELLVLCPLMLSLTSAAPIFRGMLSDHDCRWEVISCASDDRTAEEKGLQPLKNDRYRIPKSRYDSVDCYISPLSEQYNDTELLVDEDLLKVMLDAGIDRQLARHVAHLFIRDPLSLFAEQVNQDDEHGTDHFENLQSTNWQTMRFKPPPPNSSIGWRVEFRPMETQLTDFENAAFSVFIVLLTRVILTYKLNLLIPLSKVDENMQQAMKRDSAKEGRFYFRKDILTGPTTRPFYEKWFGLGKHEYTKMSLNDIFNGVENEFPGLIPLVEDYLKDLHLDVHTSCTLHRYLRFISLKASGELQTTASWMRDFVRSHPDYKQDSVVSEEINYDLMKTCQKIGNEEIQEPKLSTQHEVMRKNSKGEGVKQIFCL
ncbi:Glutamate--cysteine ligase catalytic subunit [Hypsibius exemplaris]|uniref:Glutamate--cysteine ligase n=1 Tax=Hypsibius exemplaris TaxID=2072580 RepID=A0A1W0WQH6_HYPEX|nr:Glutamate--cysteine ligase catalytic subunit [Hypsibius exemplaris]